MRFTKKTIYIGLFAILYLIVAFSSFWHACAFFGLANNSWMSIILAFAFEVGQAAVLFSLLTSKKDRSRVMPWVLMTMFTLVQVIGNVFSSYKYLITNSVEDLRYFKEPIFIWTDLPDDQATVIITYVVGAILPVAALLLTSMITNYLTDEDDEKHENKEVDNSKLLEENEKLKQQLETRLQNQRAVENTTDEIIKNKDNQIEQLKKELEDNKILVGNIETLQGPSAPIELKNEKEFIDLYNDGKEPGINTEEVKPNNDDGGQQIGTVENKENTEGSAPEDQQQKDSETYSDTDERNVIENDGSKLEDDIDEGEYNSQHPNIYVDEVDKTIKPSHFINLK